MRNREKNPLRARRGREALKAWKALAGESGAVTEDDLVDLLADLRHAFGFEAFALARRLSRDHYKHEIENLDEEA